MSPRNDKTWIEILLPLIIVLGLGTLALIWNIVAGVAILIIGLGIIVARYIQRHEPREPAE